MIFEPKNKTHSLAILIDPDKNKNQDHLKRLLKKINALAPDYIFIGGSTVSFEDLNRCIRAVKSDSKIPVIIFPGSHNQIHELADGILFLSLISGRNPDYLIGHHVESAHLLKKMKTEVIPTGYILIDGGKNSSVQYVSQTTPIPADQTTIAVKTAIAGEMLGMKAIFLDAGSGAINPVPSTMIKEVKKNLDSILIVGGGIKSSKEAEDAFNAGADIVVIGNKIEEDVDFMLDLMKFKKEITA
ncbi:MAG: geranylgeranylglyceryl/heptaprenylglyceryl phosphate synthase [Crocinitomicaceae bacterium]|nr:geranylgeranylglyceryl/heptaprenylglyceryl phosphate synthase [Crocinitomicaceae bacterium]